VPQPGQPPQPRRREVQQPPERGEPPTLHESPEGGGHGDRGQPREPPDVHVAPQRAQGERRERERPAEPAGERGAADVGVYVHRQSVRLRRRDHRDAGRQGEEPPAARAAGRGRGRGLRAVQGGVARDAQQHERRPGAAKRLE